MSTRTLVLIRHAKARKRRTALLARIDLTRPLIRRGRKDARTMGKRLARTGLHPDLIWSSPAKRALETARIIAKQLRYKRRDIHIDPRLYATTASALLLSLRRLKRSVSKVVLCGHNPELQSLAQRLGAQLDELPTCGVVELEFSATRWTLLGKPTLIRAAVDYPRKSAESSARRTSAHPKNPKKRPSHPATA
jgi:phosphohistidine phosphatase